MKGSAVFWFNMVDVGEVDTRLVRFFGENPRFCDGFIIRTKHGACPVLYGSKWISNKWFRSQGNELNRLCPNEMHLNLLPDVDFRIPESLRFDRSSGLVKY